MKFSVPFTFTNLQVLKKRASFLIKKGKRKKEKSNLEKYLKDAEVGLVPEEYKAICLYTFILSFIISTPILSTLFLFLKIKLFFLLGPLAGFVISIFIFFQQINYPRMHTMNKSRNLERNLIPALQDIIVQLNSGVPLFRIMSGLAFAGYGEVSEEFKKIVREIATGRPQIHVIEDYGEKTNSTFFRRVLWQISNGMRAGSDMTIVIKSSIEALNREKVVQIQQYGARLNPLVMFYMLMAVIFPALGITFLIIISSIAGLGKNAVIMIFIGIFVMVTFIQIMFLGVIRTRRPSLL